MAKSKKKNLSLSIKDKAVFGALGAVTPDILLMYSKRFTMQSLEFLHWHYWVATILYLCLASIVATIFPYKNKATKWNALAVGFALPIVLGTMASVVKTNLVSPRGSQITGTLLDMVSLF